MTLALPGRGRAEGAGMDEGAATPAAATRGQATRLHASAPAPGSAAPRPTSAPSRKDAGFGPDRSEDPGRFAVPRGPPRSCCDRKGSQERHEIVFNSDSYLPHYILMDFLPFRGLMETFSPTDKNPK